MIGPRLIEVLETTPHRTMTKSKDCIGQAESFSKKALNWRTTLARLRSHQRRQQSSITRTSSVSRLRCRAPQVCGIQLAPKRYAYHIAPRRQGTRGQLPAAILAPWMVAPDEFLLDSCIRRRRWSSYLYGTVKNGASALRRISLRLGPCFRPVDIPPWNRQRLFPGTTLMMHELRLESWRSTWSKFALQRQPSLRQGTLAQLPTQCLFTTLLQSMPSCSRTATIVSSPVSLRFRKIL